MKAKSYGALAFLLSAPATLLGARKALAVDLGTGLGDVGGEAGLSDADLPEVIGGLIRTGLGLLGLILLVIVLYAGFLWMTAGGNTDKVGQAKQLLINAVIGLIITVAAYAISGFVVDAIAGAGL